MTAKYEHDDIARIAYRSWLDRGQPDGSPEIDWYYALSVVTNPEEIRPVPFGNFDTRSSDEQSLDEAENQAGNLSLDGQGIRNDGMQDEGMRNDTDLASDKLGANEVTRRSDQFNVDQKASAAPRSRKKSAESGDKQSGRMR